MVFRVFMGGSRLVLWSFLFGRIFVVSVVGSRSSMAAIIDLGVTIIASTELEQPMAKREQLP